MGFRSERRSNENRQNQAIKRPVATSMSVRLSHAPAPPAPELCTGPARPLGDPPGTSPPPTCRLACRQFTRDRPQLSATENPPPLGYAFTLASQLTFWSVSQEVGYRPRQVFAHGAFTHTTAVQLIESGFFYAYDCKGVGTRPRTLRGPLGLKGWALGRLRLKRLKAGHGLF